MRSLLFTSTFCVCQLISAQGNFPFPSSNAQWAEHWDSYSTTPPFNWMGTGYLAHYMTNADTTINGISYSKVFSGSGEYEAALRDDAGRVMIVPLDSGLEFLLYDFTLPAGIDTLIEVWYSGEDTYVMFMQCLGPVGPEGRIVVESSTGQWIEGVGSTYGLFQQPGPNLSGINYSLDCMSHNGEILYPEAGPGVCDLTTSIHDRIDPGFQIFPNPATEQINIQNATPGDQFLITTIDGRIIGTGKIYAAISTIAIDHLRAGSYIITIQGTTANHTRAFMKL